MSFLIFIVPALALHSTTYTQAMNSIQSDPDHLALMMFIKDDCQDSNKALAILEAHSITMKDILNVQVINCDQISSEEIKHLPACQYRESLPFAMYLIPPENSDPLQGPIQPMQKLITNFSSQALKESFFEYSPQFWKIINDEEEYENFLSDKRLNKVLSKIANKSIWWYGITQKFRDRLDFAIVNPRLQKNDLVIFKLINDNYVEQVYNGAKQYESLRAYLSVFASTQRLIRNIESSRNNNSTHIIHITTFQQINFHNQWVLLSINNNTRLNQIASDMKGIFTIYQQNNSALQQQLLIYPFSHNKNPIIVKDQNILELCVEMVDFLKFNLNTDVLELLKDIQQLLTSKKIITIWFFNEKNMNKCHLLWALTFSNKQQYKNIFNFYMIYDPEDDIKKQFHINKLPYLVSVDINEGQVAQIDFNEGFSYDKIDDYLDKIYQRYQIKNKQTQQYPENQKEFYFLCTQSDIKCIIAIIDQNNQVDEDVFIKAMKITNIQKTIWIVLYSQCQSLLIKKFKLTIPSLLIYDANNYQYLIMKDNYNFQNIEKFMRSKKKGWKELDYQIEIEKCGKIKRDEL